MDPISAGIAGGAASAIGGYMNYKSQENTNEQNAQLAREQMGFQERMSNTAHQREIEDLRKAGLNPILSGTGGSGSSTPAGASATMLSPRTGDMLKDTVNSGLTASTIAADLDLKNASVAKTLADTANSLETAKVIEQDIRGRRATNARSEMTFQSHIESERAKADQAKSESKRSSIAATRDAYDLPRAQSESDYDREYMKYNKSIDLIQNGIDAATSAINVRKLFQPPTVRPGSAKERSALERAGRKGLKVK